MKKLIFLLVIVFSLGSTCIAGNGKNHRGEYSQSYYKGNISSEQLPKAITKYLDKEYPDYAIIRSKKKNNGTYFVKIRFQRDRNHSYYRSLVFDHNGNVIKG